MGPEFSEAPAARTERGAQNRRSTPRIISVARSRSATARRRRDAQRRSAESAGSTDASLSASIGS